MKLVGGYLLSISGNDLSFNYDFQRHKEEVTQVMLASMYYKISKVIACMTKLALST